jgi:hypothetical protein
MGNGEKKIYESEKAPIIKMGKSLVVARSAGRARAHRRRHRHEVAGRRHPPHDLDSVLGMVTTKALHEDDFLSHDVLARKSPQLARS